MAVKAGINGFGRIGSNVFRAAYEHGADVDWVAVNDITDTATLAHLLKYDSVLGPFPGEVEATDTGLTVDGARSGSSPSATPPPCRGATLGADVVIESTGLFTDRENAAKHLAAGAQEGHHLRARQGRRRDARASASTTTPTTRTARRDLQRLLHDQLPGPGGQGPPRRPSGIEHGADDHDPRLHGRSAPARRCRTRTCAAPARRRSTSSRPRPARPRRSAWSSPSSRAS